MPKYTVQSPLRHNGEHYAIGDSVEMSAKQAKQHVQAGAITPAAEPKAAEPKEKKDSGAGK